MDQQNSTSIDATADNLNDEKLGVPHKDVSYWLNEISAARKREKDWRKEGQRILDIYAGKKQDEVPFNILFSNTETLIPALYSQAPRPVVQRRFKDEDPVGKAAAMASTRLLEFLIDTNIDGYETFHDAMGAIVVDAVLPGRGVSCVKYDASIVNMPGEEYDESDDSSNEGADPGVDYKTSESVCPDSRCWERVYFGYARKWSKVPWVAYEEYLDEKECVRLFGEEIVSKIDFTSGEESEHDGDEDETKLDEEKNMGERKTALVYKIWDRDGGRVVRYISPQYADGALKEEEDPLGLTGFYDCPRPLQFIMKSSDLLPVALYTLYENQHKELNKLTSRITNVINAIKAKALIDGSIAGDIQNLLDSVEGSLVPTDKGGSLVDGGLDKAVWFWPVDKLVMVLQQLYVAREACKKVIYEITGIADIMRGASSASETLGAQQIKQQWGTLRLKRMQKEVQRYARDMLRLMLEVAANKFSVRTWAQMTGLPFVTQEQVDQAKNMIGMQQQQYQMQQQQQVMMAMQQGQQPPPPQPFQPDPQLTQVLQAPIWEQVLECLKDDVQRAYRIDIETNSTVEAEATEDQKNIAEVMNALAQYLNGVTPLIISGSMPFEAAKSMMLAIVRRFRFGPEIEDQIKEMQPPKPKDDGAAAKAQADQQAKEMQAAQAAMQKDQQNAQAQLKTQSDMASMQLEVERTRAMGEIEKKAMQLDFDQKLLMMERQFFDKQKQMAGEVMANQAALKQNELKSAGESVLNGVQNIVDKAQVKRDSALSKHQVNMQKQQQKPQPKPGGK